MSGSIAEIPDVISFRVVGGDEKVEECYLAMGVGEKRFAEGLWLVIKTYLLIQQ